MFGPTCLLKAAKPFSDKSWKGITFVTPNLDELRTMNKLVTSVEQDTNDSSTMTNNVDAMSAYSEEKALEDILKECVELCKPLMSCISTIVVTLGHHGVVVCRDVPFNTSFIIDGKLAGAERKHGRLVSAMYYPALSEDLRDVLDIVSVSGAGDR